MNAGGFTLCRLSRREAEHLMMALAMAGGWVAVDPDIRDAVVDAMGGLYAGNWADFLALLPSSWDDACKRPITKVQALCICDRLDRVANYPIESDDGAAAREIAARVRAHLDAAAQAICQ